MLLTAATLATLLSGVPPCALGAPGVQDEGGVEEAEHGAAREASAPAPAAEPDPAPFVLCPEEGAFELRIPRDEELVYEIKVELGLIGTELGTVTFTSGVEPFRQKSVLLSGSAGPETEEAGEAPDDVPLQAWVMAHCVGDHMLYSLDHTLESRFLPQDFPQTIHRSVQKGTEQRRREQKLGFIDGQRVLSYRSDTREGAPEGTRIWREPRTTQLDHGVFDILTLIYAMRTMVDENLREGTLHLADKLRIWKIDLKRGNTSVQDVPAGSFRAVEVLLTTVLEQRDPTDSKDETFRGLFGLQGDVRFFADARTGVPLRISGELPLGPLDADVDIRLVSYRGAPAELKPLE